MGVMMKRKVSFFSGALAVTGMTISPSSAAAPQVAGKYAVMSWTLCQSIVSSTTGNYATPSGGSAPAIRNFTVPDQGGLDVSVGVITFPDNASSSGQASVSLVNIGGSAVRHNNGGTTNGITFKRTTQNLSGAFSFTETKFTFAGETYDMRVGALNGGLARTVYLVRAESPDCLLAISATKQ